jgi:hypothetical protein
MKMMCIYMDLAQLKMKMRTPVILDGCTKVRASRAKVVYEGRTYPFVMRSVSALGVWR